jgi:glycerol kinase
MRKFILTIDQGTTSSRVTVYNNRFNVVDTIKKEFTQFFPNDGWVEHNALEIWNDVKALISKILKKNKLKGSQILSIGITNQRETTVLWDKITGKPIYNAIVWQDRRTTGICSALKKKMLVSKIQKITGLIIDPYFSATKIKWILTYAKNAKKLLKKNNLLFGTIDTWLLWNLTKGKSHLTDITNASRTMLFDSKKEKWSKELLSVLKIPSKILPKVVENTFDFGETNLFGETIKIGGMAGDQQAATIGQACFHSGQSKSTYGTGCFLLMNIGSQFKLSKNRLLTTVAYKIGTKKMYCYEGSIFVAGSAIQWLRDKLLFFKNVKETEKLYSKANINEKLIIVPALTGLGAPHWKPNARGIIIGITRNTSIPDMVKATIDSITFQTYDLVSAMEKDSASNIKEMRVDGGMVTNNNFIQSLSNTLQKKIIKPKNIETTSLGVAYLAALSCGLLKNTSAITSLWESSKIFKPKIKKSLMTNKINEWQKIVSILTKNYP